MEKIDDVWPFARDPQNPLLPPPRLAEIRDKGDLVEMRMYDGIPVTLATTYEQVVAVLTHPEVSSDGTKPGFPYASDSTRANRGSRPTIDRLDNPEHNRQRAMLAPYFSAKRVLEHKEFIEETVDGLLDKIERQGSAELLTEFAERLPATVVTRIMGLPYEDADFILDRIHIWMNDTGEPAAIAQAMEDMKSYFSDALDQRAGKDGDDFLSRLVREQLEPGNISRNQLLLTLHLVVSAGFETTANAITLGTVALLDDGEAWRDLAQTDDDGLVKSAVEEILRFLSVAHTSHFRLPLAPIPVGHQVIPAGQGVVAPQMSANHDPRRFEDPDRLDIRRDAKGHVAFGNGLHQCLGQNLARLELQTVFRKMPKRFPTMRLAKPLLDIRFKTESIAYGADAVPVEW